MKSAPSENKTAFALAVRAATPAQLSTFLEVLYDELREAFPRSSVRRWPAGRSKAQVDRAIALVKLYWALLQISDQDSFSNIQDFREWLEMHFTAEQSEDIFQGEDSKHRVEKILSELQEKAEVTRPVKRDLSPRNFQPLLTPSSILENALETAVYSRFSKH